jgi:hypothetical protein
MGEALHGWCSNNCGSGTCNPKSREKDDIQAKSKTKEKNGLSE